MKRLQKLIERNRSWTERISRERPEFFANLAQQQTPQYLWIGCSDSRVSADAIVDLMPGEIFVHRNIANLVIHTDLNCLSVIQYAVDVLKVKHVIICGHYGCGGIKATLEESRHGLIDNWLCHIKDTWRKFEPCLMSIEDDQARFDRLCEINVIEQVVNISQTTIIRDAWQSGQDLTIHGWIYRLQDGRIRDLDVSVNGDAETDGILKNAMTRICSASA